MVFSSFLCLQRRFQLIQRNTRVRCLRWFRELLSAQIWKNGVILLSQLKGADFFHPYPTNHLLRPGRSFLSQRVRILIGNYWGSLRGSLGVRLSFEFPLKNGYLSDLGWKLGDQDGLSKPLVKEKCYWNIPLPRLCQKGTRIQNFLAFRFRILNNPLKNSG